MSFLDVIHLRCPNCGEPAEFYAKTSEWPSDHGYTLDTAPAPLLREAVNHPILHPSCGAWIALFDARLPPVTKPPEPTPRLVVVKPPAAGAERYWPSGEPIIPETPIACVESTTLDPVTDKAVDDFAAALKAKLARAGAKRGFTDEWSRQDWRENCLRDLRAHVEKGDPLDVAAYAMFCHARGWRTTGKD